MLIFQRSLLIKAYRAAMSTLKKLSKDQIRELVQSKTVIVVICCYMNMD